MDSTERLTPAPVLDRFAAFGVDLVVVCMTSYAIAVVFPDLISISDDARALLAEAQDSLPMDPGSLLEKLRIVAIAGLWLTVAQTYFILLEWRWGRTLGKAAFGLRVVRSDGGEPLGFITTAVRDSVRWLWDAHLGSVFAVVMMGRGAGRRVGDLMSGLRVVKGPTK